MKRFILLSSSMILFTTLLSLFLGCVIHRKNACAIQKNETAIILFDVLGTIRYNLDFVGDVEDYGALPAYLQEKTDELLTIDNLFILDNTNRILFRSNMKALSKEMKEVRSGRSLLLGSAFYTAMPLNDNYRLLAQADGTGLREDLDEQNRKFAFAALLGSLLTEGSLILIRFFVKSRNRLHFFTGLLVGLWIFLFSAGIGVVNTTTYMNSLDQLKGKIESSFSLDLLTIFEKGGTPETISGVETYLERYSEGFPEISTIEYDPDNGDLIIHYNEQYLSRVYIDYILETVLCLALTGMILAEWRIMLEGEKENRLSEEPL